MEAAGTGVTRFGPGEEVFGTRTGALAGYVSTLADNLEDGKVAPTIDRAYPLADAADAFRHTAGAEPQLPKWMAGLDRLRPGPALGLGALAAAVNPKNAALTISAATSVAAAGLPGEQQVITLAVFVLLGSAGILAPLGIYLATAGSRRGWHGGGTAR